MPERPESLERFDSTPQNFLASSLQKIRDLRDVHHMVKTLEEENARLKSVLQQVTGGSGERHTDEIRQLLYSKTGYLNKYRPYATSSLFANPWEPRYIVLKDHNIMYYRNERDVYRNPPRGQVRGVNIVHALAASAARDILASHALMCRVGGFEPCGGPAGLRCGQINRFEHPGASRTPTHFCGRKIQLALTNTYVEVEGLKRRKYWTFRVIDALGVDLIRLSTESHSEMTSWVEALEACGCGLKKSESTSSLQDMLAEAREREGGTFQRQNSGYTSDQSDVAAYNYRPDQIRSMRDRQSKVRKQPRISTGYDGAVPVHTHPKFSLLSSERVRFLDQSGMVTLTFIVLAATNARLVLENMLKYGFRFNPFTFVRMVVAPKESTNMAMLVRRLSDLKAFPLR